MWVMTTDGFYSVVQHDDDPDVLLVRARVEDDLKRLRVSLIPTVLALTIQHTPDGDYAWRMAVPRPLWVRYLTNAASRIDYRNFKNAVYDRQGYERASVYGSVWASLLELQQDIPEGELRALDGNR